MSRLRGYVVAKKRSVVAVPDSPGVRDMHDSIWSQGRNGRSGGSWGSHHSLRFVVCAAIV